MWLTKRRLLDGIAILVVTTTAMATTLTDHQAVGHHHQTSPSFVRNVGSSGVVPRHGRQDTDGAGSVVAESVDFTDCEPQEDGTCCVLKEMSIKTLERQPILECKHKSLEKCHYTYVTQFKPSHEELCEEKFEKKCQITFKKMASKETVKKCYRPLVKKCGADSQEPPLEPIVLEESRAEPALNGYLPPLPSQDGLSPSGSSSQTQQTSVESPTKDDIFVESVRLEALSGQLSDGVSNGDSTKCITAYESSCTTKYIEKQPGKFVGDTSCEKLPVKLCGEGCRVEEGEEECHDKILDITVDVPEEVCDLNPQKICRVQTRLVPQLKPEHECTTIPQEICFLRTEPPKEVEKPLQTRWCMDPNAETEPGETYDESLSEDEVITSAQQLSATQKTPLPPPPPPPPSVNNPLVASVSAPIGYLPPPPSDQPNMYGNGAPTSNIPKDFEAIFDLPSYSGIPSSNSALLSQNPSSVSRKSRNGRDKFTATSSGGSTLLIGQQVLNG